MIVSLEAIFLSTFVMISQNRADAKRRVVADLQWQTVREEDKQNQELLNLSDQILELTKAIHTFTTSGSRAARSSPPEARDFTPSRVVGLILLGLIAAVTVVMAVPRRSARRSFPPSGAASRACGPSRAIAASGSSSSATTSPPRCSSRSPSARYASPTGVDLTLVQLLVVNMTASALAGLIPVPGGVGAAEAEPHRRALRRRSRRLDGVREIALTYRLCTSYLPRSGVLRAAMAGTEGLRLTRSGPGVQEERPAPDGRPVRYRRDHSPPAGGRRVDRRRSHRRVRRTRHLPRSRLR